MRLNATATHEILRRESEVFGRKEYNHIANVSVSHINNLRHHPIYVNSWVNGTKLREIPIGTTMPPEPNNPPGAIRLIQSTKGMFTISMRLMRLRSGRYLPVSLLLPNPVLLRCLNTPWANSRFRSLIFILIEEESLSTIPWEAILNRLLIKHTKSRSRQCNDNALVEGKNASVVGKTWDIPIYKKKRLMKLTPTISTGLTPTWISIDPVCILLKQKRLARKRTQDIWRGHGSVRQTQTGIQRNKNNLLVLSTSLGKTWYNRLCTQWQWVREISTKRRRKTI